MTTFTKEELTALIDERANTIATEVVTSILGGGGGVEIASPKLTGTALYNNEEIGLDKNSLGALRTVDPDTFEDTVAYWNNMPIGIYWFTPFSVQLTNQPRDYGLLIHILPSYNEISQIFIAHPSGTMYTRAGNVKGWTGSDNLIWYAASNDMENITS